MANEDLRSPGCSAHERGPQESGCPKGRDVTTEVPAIAKTPYQASEADLSLRASLPQVQAAVQTAGAAIVDVRSPQEFCGSILAPPGLPESCQRGGHIPGARNVPWIKACNDHGAFRTFDELKALYASSGIDGSKPVIAYCRIGERSSHTWFVLKYLLGFENVTNYDGSWAEWGNLIGAPIERSDPTNDSSRVTAEEYGELRVEVGGWPVNLISYRLEETYHCRADNGSEGATLTRSMGVTRDEAEQRALDRVRQLVARTKRQ